ncbi:hypothetical protein J1N35_022260 [Gossypium stocksii]|uniref:Uncharacterized protein n=1 Tax=Gossypium stocksii TaxID=47602 RepID=A0A9D3VHE6_9ROSI|nr:hypothetical protein J1N35_022260 [Gossypium stocksii]
MERSIPFSWEDKPEVSRSKPKVNYYDQDCPIGLGFYDLNQKNYVSDPSGSSSISVHEKKVPPPPPLSVQLKGSPYRKGGLKWWQEDPFLLAYKECTKSGGNMKHLSSEAKESTDSSELSWKKKITFSCKKSCDVSNDNLVRLSNLPPLPKRRSRGLHEFV